MLFNWLVIFKNVDYSISLVFCLLGIVLLDGMLNGFSGIMETVTMAFDLML